jgi:hypothetical protein
MRLQPFISGVMLVLILALGVWVALQYVPAPVEKAGFTATAWKSGAMRD